RFLHPLSFACAKGGMVLSCLLHVTSWSLAQGVNSSCRQGVGFTCRLTDLNAVRQRVGAWVAHAGHADTRGLRHALFRGGMFDPERRMG
ncbi:MAG: hypothetical protein Q8Q28_07225, partial [Pseudomonadota bacterium]|nr:hypothetical protein [Pseudomonadota bacterium]